MPAASQSAPSSHAPSTQTMITSTPTSATSSSSTPSIASPLDTFEHRHIGPNHAEIAEMLDTLGLPSLEALTAATVPSSIRLNRPLALEGLPKPMGETAALERLATLASHNRVNRSFIGTGYYGTLTPGVILRNIFENPGWYTQYTPYQAEIAQGRLEALLNFQTMVSDLTGLPLAGASLLDEATAAAEAMSMCYAIADQSRLHFIVSDAAHPQTIAVMKTRADGQGLKLSVLPDEAIEAAITPETCGVLLQYPRTDGIVSNYRPLIEHAHSKNAMVVMATDLLALTLLTPPGELGADVAIGSAQRFGVPMGFGGPHAAFIATKSDYVRKMPGRIIGVSRDAQGNPALRMAIQTREQHIRREKATSNICTAQALLAIIAGMYACYHGPEGLRKIALRTHTFTRALALGLKQLGHEVESSPCFDTLKVRAGTHQGAILTKLAANNINIRIEKDYLGISLDETVTTADLDALLTSFAVSSTPQSASINSHALLQAAQNEPSTLPAPISRTSGYLTHPVFNTNHSEHEMLRYIFKLMGRDLSLAHSMIPLGSCTMKLNATSEMIPVTWKAFGALHPFAPADQTMGYQALFRDLEQWLAEVTGFSAVSLQPNAGAQGEYTGLMVIRAYHQANNNPHRTVCLIPESAHGTNPASAVIAGFDVVVVANTPSGDIDLDDLKAKADEHKDRLGALMATYPSTYGVFEEHIKEICEIVHSRGGQVYMDGANMNAQVGLCRPGDIGADVCHLNLHKTFCIPHGGGGPGMGPIGVAKHLAPYLPGHPVTFPATLAAQNAGDKAIGPVSAAPYGSPSILVISWMYIAMMAADGLKKATQVAILNANYMAKRLENVYPVLYKGKNGRCAHEFIIDVRHFDKSAGIKTDDIAKRLMDYGFHAPTMSWPVPGTLMIEPTESESKAELDRFCDAMISIREEIRAIEEGRIDRLNNPLKHAPHTSSVVTADTWDRPYSRQQAAFPLPYVREHKFWPAVGRVDNPYGDRNLICTCLPMEAYAEVK